MRILIADDHELVRRGLRDVLESEAGWEVCGEASDGRRAVALAAELNPDVVIVDLAMPELNGLEATRQIRRASPATKVLVCSVYASEEHVDEALGAGAHAYVPKLEAAGVLVSAVRAAVGGGGSTQAAHQRQGPQGRRACSGALHAHLTPREREVFQLLVEGKTNDCIAVTLDISRKTVETHRANMLMKLGLRSIAELVRYALRNELLTP